jgi:CheY-like chemotaxis protein
MKHHTATIDVLATSPSANNSTRPRLLVVEDDAAMRELHALVLNLQGYQVEIACDGAAGLERLADEEFDLVVDVVVTERAMPNLDGVRMVLALRSAGSKYPDRHGLRFPRGGTATAQVACEFSAMPRKPTRTAEILSAVAHALPRTRGPKAAKRVPPSPFHLSANRE